MSRSHAKTEAGRRRQLSYGRKGIPLEWRMSQKVGSYTGGHYERPPNRWDDFVAVAHSVTHSVPGNTP